MIEYPILCTEPWARLAPAKVTDRSSFYYPASLASARWWRYVCTLIPSPGAAARYGQQHRSAVPVLMINGSDDPQDPPANMAGATRIWPNSREVVEPGQGHDIGLQAGYSATRASCRRSSSGPARRA